MKCLIDADILVYEISSTGQFTNEEGVLVVRDFNFVAEALDQRIKEIEAECWATEPSTLYLTGDEKLFRSINRKRRREGEEELKEFKENFRKEIATTKEYKGSRKTEKPFHFNNIREYMLNEYDVVVAFGLEADDLIAIELTKAGDKLDVICCTRDKDLRMVPGMHFGWPCGAQPQYGPKRVTHFGELHYDEEKNKLTGDGFLFFCAQLIVGDKVDNIPGLPRGGDALAWKLLKDCTTVDEAKAMVLGAYKEKLGEDYLGYFREQANLLWMVRELDDEGQPKIFFRGA